MAYSDVAALAADPDFTQRTVACYAVETANVVGGEEPYSWQGRHAWDMAAQPGFGDAYASAIQNGIGRPGNFPSVISDAQILAAVQSIMAAENPPADDGGGEPPVIDNELPEPTP